MKTKIIYEAIVPQTCPQKEKSSASLSTERAASEHNLIGSDLRSVSPILIDKFSDLQNFDIGEETKIYINSLMECSKIRIITKFDGEILQH